MKKVAVGVAFLIGLGAGWMTSWGVRKQALERQAEIEKWKSAEKELRARLDTIEKERAAERVEAPRTDDVAPRPVAAPAAPPPKISADDPVTRAELVRLLNEKNEKLAAAENSLAALQNRLHEIEEKAAALTEEQGKLVASEKQLQERLDGATRLTEVLQADMKQRNERLAQLEVANQELRKKSDQAGQQFTRFGQISDDLMDLSRRREAYMNNIIRRYREATDQFRTLALRFDNPRDSTGSSSQDLSRIQNVISLADEDMRQLQSLNAQATRLQRELAVSRK